MNNAFSGLHRSFIFLPLLLFFTCLFSCKKYLDKKPEKSLVLITSLKDIQALLDMYDVMNVQSGPGLLELAADDYYVTQESFNSVDILERQNYVWDPRAMLEAGWVNVYQRPVYYANVALDQLPGITVRPEEQKQYNELKGAALFFRAWSFYHLAQLYCQPYAQSTLDEPGIVLRLGSAILERSERATIRKTYEQITNDLTVAVGLLPETSAFPTRPNKAAAFGALARVNLAMRNYDDAGRFADSCLLRNSQLMDYNQLDSNASVPFSMFNKEVVFYSTLSVDVITSMYYSKADSVLINSYAPDDLRRGMFFNKNDDGTWTYSASYEGSGYPLPFNGVAVDEMFLIRAEAAARAGNISAAMFALNTLLKNRWNASAFTDFTAATPAVALQLILQERRKELTSRGIRWMDLRRLNLEGAGITLKRIINGKEYSLPAGDARWVMLIPDIVISQSNIPQNPR
ncbi:MAG: RagB/SusD family nutrient uptake outer membrane protein [Pseudobacter sp.]|uniref:RagB/SusD family nutrient uptake outer membrane protein n=1 Tax=Pseudobacter sp. TaxID=2045420 RepID=UPI003F7D7FF6